MKKWKMFILGFAIFVNGAYPSPQVLDKVTAVVNNGVVLESDLHSVLSNVQRVAQDAKQKLLDEPTLRRQILDRLIMDNIILQMAQSANITISDERLDQAIKNIATQHHITLAQLRRHPPYAGMNYNTYRMNIRKEMLIAEMIDRELRRRINILPQEVDSLAQQIATQTDKSEEFNLSHILIPLPENPTQNQLEKAEALANFLVEKSRHAADFDRLAITYKADLQSLKPARMGWKKLEELPTLFESPLANVQNGSIVGPIRSGAGFHILKVNNIRGGQKKVMVTEVHARHIFLRTSVVMTDQQARAKLEDSAENIKRGGISFNDAAKQLSEDSFSANQGGDLGWSPVDAFDPAVRDTLMHLRTGEISAPIHSASGWHLMQLIDTRQSDRTELAHKDSAYRLLSNQKITDEVQTWMRELRAAAYVKIIDQNGP